MKIAIAALADYAEALNNKLYISGGLVTRVGKPAFPALLDLSLVLLLEQESDDPPKTELAIRLVDPDGNEVEPTIRGEIGVEPAPPDEGTPPLRSILPLTLRLPFPIDRPGRWAIRAAVDDAPEYVLGIDVHPVDLPAG
jgi:hypothetical protein